MSTLHLPYDTQTRKMHAAPPPHRTAAEPFRARWKPPVSASGVQIAPRPHHPAPSEGRTARADNPPPPYTFPFAGIAPCLLPNTTQQLAPGPPLRYTFMAYRTYTHIA